MKYLLIIALLCASVCSFGQEIPNDVRKVKKCGFATQQAAIQNAAQTIIINDDETVTQVELTGQTGAWCIELTIKCTTPPDIAKVIKSQECKLIEIE